MHTDSSSKTNLCFQRRILSTWLRFSVLFRNTYPHPFQTLPLPLIPNRPDFCQNRRGHFPADLHPIEVKETSSFSMDAKTPTTQKGTPRTPVCAFSSGRAPFSNPYCRIRKSMASFKELLRAALSLARSPSIVNLMYLLFPFAPLTCVEHCILYLS